MPNKQFKRDWLPIIAIGLIIQLFWAWRLIHPSYMDAYYYTINGARLADGFGFTVPVVWQFLDGIQELPAPSHTYWMPFPALLAMLGYLFGDSFRLAQIPFWLLAGTLPLLSFVISSTLTGKRWQAWTAALYTSAGGYYAAYLSQPTSFAPFAWAVGLGLLCLSFGSTDHKKLYWGIAGILAGVAHLTRADGLLLLLIGFAVWGWQLLLAIRNNEMKSINWLEPIFLLIGYLIVMSPWFARNITVIGRPMPTAGTQTMFLTNYSDLFSYGRSFHLPEYLAWGWGNILRSKWDTLWLTIQTLIAVSGLIFLLPFSLLAWIRASKAEPKRTFLRPVSWFTIGLVMILAFVFTFPAGRGSVLHSSAGIWAWMMPLAVAGIGMAIDWISARRHHWQPEQAKRIFAIAFGIIVFLITPIVAGNQPLRRAEGQLIEQIGGDLPANSVLMAGNPPMVYYHAAIPAITLPNEPFDVVQTAQQNFGVSHLLLDIEHPAHMDGLWTGEVSYPQLKWLADYSYEGEEKETYLARCREIYDEDTPETACPVFKLYQFQNVP